MVPYKFRASLVAQMVKNPPAKQVTPVLSLGQEDPLQKEMAAHSSILAWEIPWTEEPGRLQFMRLQKTWPNDSVTKQKENHLTSVKPMPEP